ncbi:HD domain-containing phosphohydrolase [Cupriavidus plantarum]|uniref:HD domain-containing phosphohydrolase n=1 Tax=Cupriavidus plantarum TaxID=942865 RepID=UPI000E397F6F|nr:HD domain-containing phosphohydrolase [Cupriavidus plantarum]REF02409.1 GAF domain-containing protein [Cupriavidus plantarum]
MNKHRSYPLHVYLWALFGSLVLLVCALTAGINFLMTKSALEANASEARHRLSRETLDDVEALLGPAQLAVRLIAHSSLAEATTVSERLARLPLVRDALDTSPVLQSLYVGYGDGEFFFVRPLRDDAERALYQAPRGASFVVRSVEREGVGEAARKVGQIYFLADSLSVIHAAAIPEFANNYDPRARPWYRSAMAAGTMVRTEPYTFFSDRDSGASLAMPAGDNTVVGGDFRLNALGQMLAIKKTTPRSMLALVDQQGRLIAIDRKADSVGGSSPGEIGDYGMPVLDKLVARVGQPGAATGLQETLAAGGESWYTTIDRLTPSGGKSLYLLSAIPQDELLQSATRQALTEIGVSALILLLSLPVIWFAARFVARPLQSLAREADATRRFDFVQPFVIRSRVSELNELGVRMDDMRRTIQRFLSVMQTVSAETRLEDLLPKLLREMLTAAGSHSGVLYLVDKAAMRAEVAFDREGREVAATIARTTLAETVPLIRTAAADGTARAQWLTHVTLADAGLGGLTPAAACHAAAIPLINHQRDLVGMILIFRDTPMEEAQLAFVNTLANLCAGALEVQALTRAQRDLFDAFIKLLAGAIDAKSPHTGGHCARVPELTKMFARAACDAREGPYGTFSLDDSQWEALHVAAWLHDCGKVTTPEYVIDKATKLETLYDRIHEVRMRFEVLKRDAEIACLRGVAAGHDPQAARARRDAALRELDDDFAFVAGCNIGGETMAEADRDRLRAIGARTWLRTLDDRLGISYEERTRKARLPFVPLPAVEPLLADRADHVIERGPRDVIPRDNPWGFRLDTPANLYDRGELHNLLVARGTLSAEERFKIEDHIVQTQIMLSRLPFPKHLRQVPEIAGGHHEKMDGTGYPRGLRGDEMSPLARMMAIADIFEALTAVDRPYKRPKSLSQAVEILYQLKRKQHIDPELFDLFLTSGVYRQYAERFMAPEQIDEVDVGRYVGEGVVI